MYPDSPFAHPVGSFQVPIDPLVPAPGDDPLVTVCINESWLEVLRGCAKQLLLQSTWRTNDPDTLNVAQGRAFEVLHILQPDICNASHPSVGFFFEWSDSFMSADYAEDNLGNDPYYANQWLTTYHFWCENSDPGVEEALLYIDTRSFTDGSLCGFRCIGWHAYTSNDVDGFIHTEGQDTDGDNFGGYAAGISQFNDFFLGEFEHSLRWIRFGFNNKYLALTIVGYGEALPY